MFYSPSKNAFYAADINPIIPGDAIEISAQRHTELLSGQCAGKRIQADANGAPVSVAVAIEPPTPEQLREAAKAARAVAVGAIKVTTQAGHTFDGDEISQGRMARAIIALRATSTSDVTWVLADNSTLQATAAELSEALALAGAAQAALWVLP